MTAAVQLDLLDLLAEPAPARHPTRPGFQLTDDERLAIWQGRLPLPALCADPDRAISVLKDSGSYSGDWRRSTQVTKAAAVITLQNRAPVYGGPCPDYCTRPSSASVHTWAGSIMCAPHGRGHWTPGEFTVHGPPRVLELRWTRLTKWIGSLTDEDRAEIIHTGSHHLLLHTIHWPLTRLLGPPPRWADIFGQP